MDGIPSPNPQFPQPIKNVTGNANVKIQNKNLFDKDNANILKGYIDNANKIISYNTNTSIFIPIQDNIDVTIKKFKGTTPITCATSVDIPSINSIVDNKVASNDTLLTYHIVNNAKYLVVFCQGTKDLNAGYTVEDILENLQIEQGTTATSYVEHQEQNLPFTFEEGQFLADDGELKDSGIYNEFQKIIFDGTENILTYESGDNYDGFAIKIKNTYLANAGERSTQKYNYFMELGHSAAYGRQPNKATMGTDGYLYVFFEKNVVADVTAVRNWLATKYANGNPLIAIGKVKNPISIPYNATQQAQYNAIKKAKAYNDITHISQTNDDLPFKMDLEALKGD